MKRAKNRIRNNSKKQKLNLWYYWNTRNEANFIWNYCCPKNKPRFIHWYKKATKRNIIILLSGTRKTMIAKAIVSECNSIFFIISASSVTSKWVKEREKTLKSLFKLTYKKIQYIIIID